MDWLAQEMPDEAHLASLCLNVLDSKVGFVEPTLGWSLAVTQPSPVLRKLHRSSALSPSQNARPWEVAVHGSHSDVFLSQCFLQAMGLGLYLPAQGLPVREPQRTQSTCRAQVTSWTEKPHNERLGELDP